MIAHSLAASLAVLSLSLAPAPAAAADGMTFRSPDGRLSVWVPSKPKITEQQIPGASGARYQSTLFAVEGPDYLLLASVLDLGKDGASTEKDEKVFLDGMLADLREGMGERFELDAKGGVTDLTLKSEPMRGRQLRGKMDGQPMIIRAYVTRRAIYQLQATFPAGNAAAAKIADRFLSSLVAKR